MASTVKRNVFIGAICVVLAGGFVYYHLLREITVYATTDGYSGMHFKYSCVWAGLEMHFYVTVTAPMTGRLISRTEIAPSADMPQDCLEQPFFRASSIKPDKDYSKLTIGFEDEGRPPVDVPLNLVGIDGLPESIQQPRRQN